MKQIAEQLQKLTEQLNQFRHASKENVGAVHKQVSEQFEQRLELQPSSRINMVDESVKKSQKTAEDNAELLQNVLVGIENMGENLKKLREDMELWQTPEYQDAEREYVQMNSELMEEVTPFIMAVTEPIPASISPHVSVPQFSAPLRVNVPYSGGNAVDTEFRETWSGFRPFENLIQVLLL